MAKKKGPPQPRKKSPEELIEEAFQAKCAEAAKNKAPAPAAGGSPVASGIKIMNRPPSVKDLVNIGMKKSSSAASLQDVEIPRLTPEEEEPLMAEVAAAADMQGLMKALGAPSDKVQQAAGDKLKVRTPPPSPLMPPSSSIASPSFSSVHPALASALAPLHEAHEVFTDSHRTCPLVLSFAGHGFLVVRGAVCSGPRGAHG